MPPKRPATAAAAPTANEQQLGLKDQTLFKQVLRFYETKQYKKALKAADTILKKTPNHGETLAMKGLIFNNLKRKEEAHQLVKRGLALNVMSHVCWHVYGLLYRSENKYEDAIKCYQNAIKRDPNNLQIMKDLSNLQIQRRMLTGFTETRRKLLQAKSNNKHNWLAYAIGNQLCGQTEKALSILDALVNTTDMGQRAANDKRPVTYEESETHLYRAMLLEEAGKPAEAIKYLAEKAHEILDKLHAVEKRGQLHLALGEVKEAEALYRQLLAINPENYAYHVGLQKALGFIDVRSTAVKSFLNVTWTPEQSERLLALYTSDPLFASKAMAKVSALRRIPLNFTRGDTFRRLVDAYMREKISRGIPSLFSDLESLYTDAEKCAVIGELVEGYLANLRTDNRFSQAEEKNAESPSSFIYAAYFAAQHYDHLNDHARALQLVDESLAHTNTSPDTYMLKARIYKHAGDPITAYGYMDTARRLDTQDRNLNVKCVRYALRADQLKAAEDTVQLFLRDGDGLKALEDLQVCWYENAAAELHIRAKQYGKALKKLLAIDKHFTDIYEDQFDFHSYCFRKSTLRAYVDMVRWADTIRGHRFHVRAALNLVRVYLRLYDAPREEASELDALALEQNLSEEEKKEAAKRAKKAAAKARAAEEKRREQEAAEKAAAAKGKAAPKDLDTDPEGLELLKADPLQEATRHLLHLTRTHAQALQTQTLAVAVYLRKERFLLALRHMRKAIGIDAAHPDTHFAKCTFLHAARQALQGDKLAPLVKEVLEAEIATDAFGKGATPVALNSAYLQQHSSSLAHRLSCARVLFALDPVGGKAESLSLASKLDAAEPFTRVQAMESLTFLRESLKAPEAAVVAFQATALKKFPLAVAFGATPNPPPPIDSQEQKA